MQYDVKCITSSSELVFFSDKVKDVLVIKGGDLCPFRKRDPMVLVNGKEYPSVADFIQFCDPNPGDVLFVGMKHMLCQHVYLQRLFDHPEVRFYFEGYDADFEQELRECFQRVHQELRTYQDEEIQQELPELNDIKEFKRIQKFVGRQEALEQIKSQKAVTNDSNNGNNTSECIPSSDT